MPGAVAREEQPPPPAVPQGEREHAAEPREALDPVGGVGGQQHLGVRPRPEAVPARLELGAELPEVVDLPVADDLDARVVGRHRLARRVAQIDDGQAPVREPDRALGARAPAPSGPRWARRSPMPREDRRVDRRAGAEVQAARDPAHARLRRRPAPVSGGPPARLRYQRTVRANPSAKAVRARKPNSRCARAVSSERRGCPSGFEPSHVILPSKPVSAAICSARSLIEISHPAPTFTGSAPSYRASGERDRLRRVLDVEELPRRLPLEDDGDRKVNRAPPVAEHVRRDQARRQELALREDAQHGDSAGPPRPPLRAALAPIRPTRAARWITISGRAAS